MGSQEKGDDELTVLVTGFGPFRGQYPANPSWEIARGLPSHLPPSRSKILPARPTVDTPPVRILVFPEPIRVQYKLVRSLVLQLLGTRFMGRKIDYVLHIGMAGPRPVYQIERRAHRTGYRSPDVDGEMLEDEADDGHGEDWIWRGLPDELETELDLEDVLQRWQGYSSEDMDLRISDDAGHYLCDFIYYSSLSTLFRRQRPRKVVFLHVPCDASERHVSQGRGLALNLIRAIVEGETARTMHPGRDQQEDVGEAAETEAEVRSR